MSGNLDAKHLAVHVAYYLDQANVPNILFGWLAMSLAEIDRTCKQVDFVIRDDMIERATEVLHDLEIIPCANYHCSERNVDRCATVPGRWRGFDRRIIGRYQPVAAEHFHLENGEYVISLHARSSLLWWLPEHLMPAGHPRDDPDNLGPLFQHSNNPRAWSPYGTRSWWEIHYPVRLLTRDAFTEAIIFLMCRDMDNPNLLDETWNRMLWWLAITEQMELREYETGERNLIGTFQAFWESYVAANYYNPPVELDEAVRHEAGRRSARQLRLLSEVMRSHGLLGLP
ncbi:hypothetical protein BJY04DRAFT_44145 [Aspergillus karnatakaensis]|uniref:uncharacterized protein n=1 Tax=Aspergillus karnatakaensis TaxID=1810916 RepID=UPI003CCD0F39